LTVERRLDVALQHFQRQDYGATEAGDGGEGFVLGAVGFGIVVLFAEEEDVGVGEAGEHLRRRHVGSRCGRDDAIAGGCRRRCERWHRSGVASGGDARRKRIRQDSDHD